MTKETIRAQVQSIAPITASIIQVILDPEVFIGYQAGQYLNVILNKESLSFSIANAPLGSRKYELHIRHSRDNALNQALFAHIKTQGFVDIQLPFGTCSIEHLDPACPIIFIAGGTGFAPVNAMIEQLLADDDQRSFELYWGARSQSDLYMDNKVRHWQTHAPTFNYFSLISEESSNPRKQTLSSLVVAQHPKDIAEWQIVISGAFPMVHAVRDVLVEAGVDEKRLFSDAF